MKGFVVAVEVAVTPAVLADVDNENGLTIGAFSFD